MRIPNFWIILVLAGLAVSGAHAESTVEQLREQSSGDFTADDSPSDTLKDGGLGRLAEILRKYAYLDQHFALMDSFGQEERLERSLADLRQNPRATQDLIRLYRELTEAASEETGYFGEARWRTLYVLGQLRNEGAAEFLADVALQPMPSGKYTSDADYEAEYRVRARAVAGLEQLGGVERLKRLYEEGGVLAGLAAASLFELGEPPDGVEEIDAREVIGLGDPNDFNPPRGAVPDELPDASPVERRGPEGDDLPAISPSFRIER